MIIRPRQPGQGGGRGGFLPRKSRRCSWGLRFNHAWLTYPGQPRRPSRSLRLPPCERIGKLPTAMAPQNLAQTPDPTLTPDYRPDGEKNPAFDGPCPVISVDQRCRLQAWAERTYCETMEHVISP